MLTRQLASAGSGKTYTLAKQFILFYITVPVGEDSATEYPVKRRLRTRPELVDSLRHILAITFTNKATGEMKQRIISKLAALANYSPPVPANGHTLTHEEEEADRKVRSKIDYLEEFVETLGAKPEDIARVSREALEILLNEFSDFQVSTIDSFFQQVMRTFTYEADLPDNFQLELDSNYVAALGLDTALSDLNTSRSSGLFRYWASKTVENSLSASGKWNLFAPGNSTIYNDVLSMLKTMESESFKEKLEDLREYFYVHEAEGKDHPGGYIGKIIDFYDNLYIMPLRKEAALIRRIAREALAHIASNGIDPKNLVGYLYARLNALASLNWKKGYTLKGGGEFFMLKSPLKAGKGDDPKLLELVNQISAPLTDFLQHHPNKEVKSWMVYAEALRRLALTWEIKKKIDELMVDANSLQLSDTNSILRTIIGDDETPFIYERLGAKLDHFLIDEFQDTSRLQWENTLPLLRESESRGKENLIIGDPKQSIYRFRNADSSLITTAVKQEFPLLHDAGADPKTNTNWRSDLNIVRFNNFLFHSLCRAGMDYTSSYGDVIQFSKKFNASDSAKTVKEGFVSLRFFTPPKNEGEKAPADSAAGSEEEDSGDYPEYYNELGPLILELQERGFRQKDIAVLVKTHLIGTDVISALLDFNARQFEAADTDEVRTIRFVSEDSLKVTNARSVRTIIEALRAIAGTVPFTRPSVIKPSEAEDTVAEIEDPVAKYAVFAAKDTPKMSTDLREMLAGMSVVTLPALVEQIVVTFVPEAIRRAEAPFLAAFQDSILEFSENHLADIPTFLKWWDKHGDALTISSPENTDAVQVVTVHSSKGLEFGAVIVPNGSFTFSKSHFMTDTAWMEPQLPEQPGYELPPTLPIEIKKELEGTYHQATLTENKKNVATDELNAAYVAFTRAKHELYILDTLTPKLAACLPKEEDEGETDEGSAGNGSKKKKVKKEEADNTDPEVKIPAIASVGEGILKTFLDPENALASVPTDKEPYVIDVADLQVITDKVSSIEATPPRKYIEITYGSPVDLTSRSKSADESTEAGVSKAAKDYPVNDSFPALHFQIESSLASVDDASESMNEEGEEEVTPEAAHLAGSDEDPEEVYEDEMTDEDEVIPGSELALLRELLGRLGAVGNLDRAMLPMKVSGRWTGSQLENIKELLTGVINSDDTRRFILPPEGWTVYTNRPLIHSRRKTRIPDRIHISPDGRTALVINFKLTREPEEGEWRQLRTHVRALRKTGFKGHIEGWLCHLPQARASRLTAELGRRPIE